MYFTEQTIDFLAGLALNNEKSWFDHNRKIYQKEVKERFDVFLTELIDEVKKFDTVGDLPLQKFKFRINRDVRFSKDKSPYNPWASAVIGPEGKKTTGPLYYVRVGVEGVQIGGGVYMPSSEQLKKIRDGLVQDNTSLRKLLDGKEFVRFYDGKIGSDQQYKTLPKAYKQAAESEPLLYEKGFTYMKSYPIDVALQDDFLQFVVDHFRSARDINHWFAEKLVA